MTRNLKVPGLALIAIFAMSAVVAAAALAKEEGLFIGIGPPKGDHGTTLVTGEDKATDRLEFTSAAGTVKCGQNVFHGEIPGGTAKELALTPTWGGSETGGSCSAGGLFATLHSNGCQLGFYTAETKEENPDKWNVLSKIACPAGVAGITTTVFLTHSGHTNNTPICTVTLPPQSGLQGVTIHNTTHAGEPTDLTATFNITNATKTESGLCGHGHGTMSLHGSVTLEGTNEDLEATDVYVGLHGFPWFASLIHEKGRSISIPPQQR